MSVQYSFVLSETIKFFELNWNWIDIVCVAIGVLVTICRQHIHHHLADLNDYPDSKVHGANMGPTWVLSALDGPHAGPMNSAIYTRGLGFI